MHMGRDYCIGTVQIGLEEGKESRFSYENTRKNITDSHVRGKAAAANYAAVPTVHTSSIHFDLFEAAGNASGIVSR